MTKFQVGDKVRVTNAPDYAPDHRNRTGVVSKVMADDVYVQQDKPFEGSLSRVTSQYPHEWLTKENDNVNENKNAADLLRRKARDYAAVSIVSNAFLAAAYELDPPKPKVEVKHSVLEPYKVLVTFERKEDAKAISHFLYRADHLIDGVYNDQPGKQDVVRAFVEAWHARGGK